jgi:hypothetical protein
MPISLLLNRIGWMTKSQDATSVDIGDAGTSVIRMANLLVCH